mmetsp:Transcript_55356/g.110010  ORF Transcript_55356/g.110010 Transcript_55356/m.110010 type:complete len:395 (-) Transcript_55356:143-1327(-)
MMVPSPVGAKSPASAGAKRHSPVPLLHGEQKRAKQDGSCGAGDDEQPIDVGRTPEAQFRAVIQALQDEALESPGIPMVARTMLAEGARPWLKNVTNDGLHDLQKQILGQIRETFNSIASGMDTNIEDRRRDVKTKTSELSDLEAQLQDAFRLLAQADAQIEVSREKQLKAEQQVNWSQANDKAFKERRRERAKEVQMLHNELKHCAAVEEGLKPLVEGTCPIEDQKKVCDRLMEELQKLGSDAALLVALPMVLDKKPDERKSFDLIVLDGVKDVLRKTMETVESKLSAANEAIDGVNQEADAHTAASIKLYSDLDDEIREVQMAEEVRKDRAAAIKSLENQAEDCRNLLGASAKSSEASKAIREKFSEVQNDLESLMSAASSLEEVDAMSEAQK